MKKYLLSAGILALTLGSAEAEIFDFSLDRGFFAEVNNSPTSVTSGRIPLNQPRIEGVGQFDTIGDNSQLQINIQPGKTPGSEWIIFSYQDFGFDLGTDPPLSQPFDNWSVLEDGIPTIGTVKLISILDQFKSRVGIDLVSPLTPKAPFSGQKLIHKSIVPSNIVGDGGDYWWGQQTNIVYKQGQIALGAFLDPFNNLEGSNIDPLNVYGFVQAFEFVPVSSPAAGLLSGRLDDPATGVPEPETWMMMLLGFIGLGIIALKRKRIVSA